MRMNNNMDHNESNNPNYEGGEGQGPRSVSMRHQYLPRPKICQFCADKNLSIDYKQYDTLRRFVMEGGKIRPRRQTGTCAKHQRELAREIKRARHIALLPFSSEGIEEKTR